MSNFLSTLKSASPFLSTFLSAVIFFEFFFEYFFEYLGETQTFMQIVHSFVNITMPCNEELQIRDCG